MRQGFPLWVLVTLFLLAFVTACASHSIRALPRVALESLPSRGTLEEIDIGLEPYETDTKTVSFFGRKLVSEGVVPILVILRNRGESPYELSPHEISLVGPGSSSSPAATATATARTTGANELDPVAREAVAIVQGVFWPLSILLLPVTLPLGIADGAALVHNKRLAREYLGMGLPHYVPKGETRGFVFFMVPKSKSISLEGYRVRFDKIGLRGAGEYLSIEIPLVDGPP